MKLYHQNRIESIKRNVDKYVQWFLDKYMYDWEHITLKSYQDQVRAKFAKAQEAGNNDLAWVLQHYEEVLFWARMAISEKQRAWRTAQRKKDKRAESREAKKKKLVFTDGDFLKKRFPTYPSSPILADVENSYFEPKEVLHLHTTLWQNAIPLGKLCLIARGAIFKHKTKQISKKSYIYPKKEGDYKPFLEGKNIQKYVFSQHGWLDYKPTEHYNSMFPELFENEKIMFINVVKDTLRFAYDDQHFYNSHTIINCVRIDKLQTATHISAKKALKEGDLELAKEYDYMFLLGLLNSTPINWYFKSFLSEGLHFYPNDAKNLPIIKIDKKDKVQKKLVDKVIEQTKLLLALIEKNAKAIADNDIFQMNQLSQRIWYAEREIDKFVLDLYGITNPTDRDLILQS